jgi:hypothetical protein
VHLAGRRGRRRPEIRLGFRGLGREKFRGVGIFGVGISKCFGR